MAATTEYGGLRIDESAARVRFERLIDATIDAVWDLVATGDGLAKWLASATVDLDGGVLDLDFGEEGLAGGRIIEARPPEVLEYHWQFPGEPDSIVRFELSTVSGKTQLVLDHRLLPLDQAVAYGAGWHAHLDQLTDVAEAREAREWTPRFEELMPRYEAIAAS